MISVLLNGSRVCGKLVSDGENWEVESMRKKPTRYISDSINNKKDDRKISYQLLKKKKSKISTALPLQCRLGDHRLRTPCRAVGV